MRIVIFVILMALSNAALAQSAIVAVKSPHDMDTTIARLEAAIASRGATIAARIDHAAGARTIGQELRPTAVIIFGNPRLGTPLMQSNQQIGLDLPMRIAIWQDAQRAVWIGYTAPGELAKRYGIADRDAVVQQMTGALGAIAAEATKP